jgi:endoglucanase
MNTSHPLHRSSALVRLAVAALALGAASLALAADAVRIRAGTTAKHTDENGVVWLADQGFAGGETIDRSGIAVANTKTPSIYTAERYSMSGFTWALPNGKYTVKLHFAETYEGIYGPGERVFSFNVEGKDFKGFDVTAKAGGVMRAYVETVEVEIADGKLDISFTSQIENPQINALEIIPAS